MGPPLWCKSPQWSQFGHKFSGRERNPASCLRNLWWTRTQRIRTTGELSLEIALLEAPEPAGEQDFKARGERRGSFYAYERASDEGQPGAGTVHHVAWASQMDDHPAWRERVIEGGGRPTPIIDRFYFRSIYFREPSSVLFEIVTIGPGFATDEPLERLGESLSLPPKFEHRRAELERILTPLPDPRGARTKSATPATAKQKGVAR